MSGVQEIEAAVLRLSPDELKAFRLWFAAFEADAWDRQMEADVTAGRLDSFGDQAIDDLRSGRCTQR